MTRIYFVRHAQSEHKLEDDRIRPLTAEGKEDAKKVTAFFADREIDAIYCSPYKRSLDTISGVAGDKQLTIQIDERLHERKAGPDGNNHEMFRKRWADLNYHEEGGESISMVQTRNIEALKEILAQNEEKNIVIGTHGTALSSILNYYDTNYDCDSFLRIIDWMPYIIELDFDGDKLVKKTEHLYIKKEFRGKG